MSGDRFSVVVPRPLFTGHGWIFVLPMGPTPARWGPASDPVGSASDRAADLASAQTSQGLTLKSGGSYDQSLQLEALNRVANQALELERIREHPGFYADYTYFDEKGTNRNVDIALQRLPGRRPIFWECSHQIRFGGDYWYVEPGTDPHTDAAGATLGIRTIFNEYWRVRGMD